MKKILVLLVAMTSFFLFGFLQQDTLSASVERGKTVYVAHCMSCHMAEGEGLEGAFPPLAKTGRLDDKSRLVKIVVNGLSGPIEVKGTHYDMEMTPVNLSDQEIMDVLNYIRNSWGNKAPIVTLPDVAKAKTAEK
jgi:mono/diheme cytochrome c family protein